MATVALLPFTLKNAAVCIFLCFELLEAVLATFFKCCRVVSVVPYAFALFVLISRVF